MNEFIQRSLSRKSAKKNTIPALAILCHYRNLQIAHCGTKLKKCRGVIIDKSRQCFGRTCHSYVFFLLNFIVAMEPMDRANSCNKFYDDFMIWLKGLFPSSRSSRYRVGFSKSLAKLRTTRKNLKYVSYAVNNGMNSFIALVASFLRC